MKGLDTSIFDNITAYQIYVAIHVIALIVCVVILFVVLWAKPSRGQSAAMFFVASDSIYTLGFLVEITSKNIDGYFAATIVEYFGICLLMIGFTLFIEELCKKTVPRFIYVLEGLYCVFTMWLLFTTKENNYFYTYIGINTDGPFPRMEVQYGWGFYALIVYMAIVSIVCFVICCIDIARSTGVERKRFICTAIAIACPWIHNLVRATGITGGYEVPCVGFTGAIILISLVLLRYGYFDSIALAGENALSHGHEGIMVIDNHHIITYFNKRVEELFDSLSLKQDAYENETLKDIFEGKITTLELHDRIYELRVEPLNEGGYVQGYMLWILDITKHHEMLMQISDLAHKDSLTGVYNISYFATLLEEYLGEGGSGSLFMMDLNHFKQVNDRFGHQVGDEILACFGQVLLEQDDNTISCRIGGDEFCLFYKEVIDARELENIARRISQEFLNKTEGEKYHGISDISYGISRVLEPSDRVFEKLYGNADKALYVAKNRSKNPWYIL